jgi:hypothetical protein
MTIYFANSGCIDLDTIRTMGVSVKDDGAIGYFGTGVKYALATLLRTGHEIELDVGGELYVFTTRTKQIRGKDFELIYMNDEQLAFTTDLGRNWEVWMAYRELHSNCLDEKGKISRTDWEGDTVWHINGEGIEEAYNNRNEIFIHGEPSWVCPGIEVYHGASHHVYYRGVRIHTLQKPTRMTYNLTGSLAITEDRTAKSAWDIEWKLSTLLPTIAHPEFCAKILRPGKDSYDHCLSFTNCGSPSEEFLDEAAKHISNAQASHSAKELLHRHRKAEKQPTVDLTSDEVSTVGEAIKFLTEHLNCALFVADIKFVEHLGAGVYGLMEDGVIFIPRQTIANGRDFLAITLWEEFLHRDLGLRDESRSMQQYLFDKVLALTKKKETS